MLAISKKDSPVHAGSQLCLCKAACSSTADLTAGDELAVRKMRA